MKYIISPLLLIIIGCNSPKEKEYNQKFSDKILQLVLSENKIEQEYLFKISNKKEIREYHLTYLGEMKREKGNLKFVNYTIYSGFNEESKRANNRVFIFDSANKKLGDYYTGGVLKDPIKVIGTNLFFPLRDKSCTQTTLINFRDSIPNEIFLNCNKEGGDFYNLEKPETTSDL